jgi:hypothetical protein
MQGEPIQFLAESHCAVRSSEDSSLSKEQGGASGIAGKSRVANWLVAGITDDCGPPHLRQAARRNVVAVERLAGLAGLDAGAARHHAGSRGRRERATASRGAARRPHRAARASRWSASPGSPGLMLALLATMPAVACSPGLMLAPLATGRSAPCRHRGRRGRSPHRHRSCAAARPPRNPAWPATGMIPTIELLPTRCDAASPRTRTPRCRAGRRRPARGA